MLKRCVIFIFLTTAYTVLLAHNFTPHHSFEDINTEHHQDKDHHNDHDHDQDKDLGDLFAHFQHAGTENQFISTHQNTLVKKIDVSFSTNLFSCQYNLILFETEEPLIILFPDRPPIYSSLGKYAFALRGPPSFTA